MPVWTWKWNIEKVFLNYIYSYRVQDGSVWCQENSLWNTLNWSGIDVTSHPQDQSSPTHIQSPKCNWRKKWWLSQDASNGCTRECPFVLRFYSRSVNLLYLTKFYLIISAGEHAWQLRGNPALCLNSSIGQLLYSIYSHGTVMETSGKKPYIPFSEGNMLCSAHLLPFLSAFSYPTLIPNSPVWQRIVFQCQLLNIN